MKKIICFLMTAVVLLCGLPATTAEKAAGTIESGYDVAMSVVDLINQNMSEGRILTDEEAQAHCEKLYGYLPEDLALDVVYDKGEYFGLLKQLNTVLYETDLYSDIGLEYAEAFYVCVWMIGYDQISGARPQIKEIMKDIFTDFPDDAISRAVDLCIEFIHQKNPDLFENDISMGYLTGDSVSGDDEYLANFREGFQLFEEGKYAEAIEAYKKCIAVNPYDISVNFEIIEAYVSLRDYDSAEEWMEKIESILSNNRNKAHWLRKKGFIAIEKLDFELAYAYYAYSQKFEQSSSAEGEIQYIEAIAPKTKHFTPEEAETYLRERGLALDP